MDKKAEIGIIGLAQMGRNLALNFHDHGYSVAVFNRTFSVTENFLSEKAAGRDYLYGSRDLEGFINILSSPRKIMISVKAGQAVDDLIDLLIPLLDKGDLIIDGGNSYYIDTGRRAVDLEKRGLLFLGTGVSGGSSGARRGPSLMPGGNVKGWLLIKDMFQSICAVTESGLPCCDWVGENGAGHYVKMVHNGIEYTDMQLIAEAYHLMKTALAMGSDEIADIFSSWNKGALNSYLMEISANILNFRENGEPFIEKILDRVGRDGVGKMTAISALNMNIPLSVMGESAFARALSFFKNERIDASRVLSGPGTQFEGDRKVFIDDLEKAILASKIVSYSQAFMLMREAAKEYRWKLNFAGISLMWRGGCTIRSIFLDKIKKAFNKDKDLKSLIMDDYFKTIINQSQESWRKTVSRAIGLGIPVPAMSAALSFYDGYRCENLPANLIQAQRDYFGAHSYERIDKPEGVFFHTDWIG